MVSHTNQQAVRVTHTTKKMHTYTLCKPLVPIIQAKFSSISGWFCLNIAVSWPVLFFGSWLGLGEDLTTTNLLRSRLHPYKPGGSNTRPSGAREVLTAAALVGAYVNRSPICAATN